MRRLSLFCYDCKICVISCIRLIVCIRLYGYGLVFSAFYADLITWPSVESIGASPWLKIYKEKDDSFFLSLFFLYFPLCFLLHMRREILLPFISDDILGVFIPYPYRHSHRYHFSEVCLSAFAFNTNTKCSSGCLQGGISSFIVFTAVLPSPHGSKGQENKYVVSIFVNISAKNSLFEPFAGTKPWSGDWLTKFLNKTFKMFLQELIYKYARQYTRSIQYQIIHIGASC